MLHSVSHVALAVERLREAEEHYRRLFALEVAFREAQTADGWATLPPEAGWEEAERAGIELGLVALHRDGFRLALEAVERVERSGRLSHLGLYGDADELRRLRDLAPPAGCLIVSSRADEALIIEDRFGVRWELNSFDYDDLRRLSSGVRTGRWLTV